MEIFSWLCLTEANGSNGIVPKVQGPNVTASIKELGQRLKMRERNGGDKERETRFIIREEGLWTRYPWKCRKEGVVAPFISTLT